MKIYKRDFFLKKNNDALLGFFYQPTKDLARWLIFYAKYIFFKISPYFFLKLRNFYLKKNRSFARNRTSDIKKYYANVTCPFHELQIKNSTRVCNIFKEEEKIIYTLNEKNDYFTFGISPLVEYYNLAKIKRWDLKIKISDTEKILDKYKLEIPYGSSNSNNLIYSASDGWVDLKLDISNYNNFPISIEIDVSLVRQRAQRYRESLSISSPTFLKLKKDYKNIIILSVESLSDIDYISNKYGISDLPNLKKLISISSSYKEVYSPIDATLTYAVSLFSGLMPSQHGVGNYSIGSDTFKNYILNEKLTTVSKKMKDLGFLNFFAGTATRLNSKMGFAKYFDDYFQVDKSYDLSNPDINWVIKKIQNFRGTDKFIFLHLDHLHDPLFAFNDKFKPNIYDLKNLDENYSNIHLEGYKIGLKKIDDQIGMLINYLKNNSEMENSLIIITGDHGNGINWIKGSDFSLYDERLRVPLIVKNASWSKKNNDNLDDAISSIFKIHQVLSNSLNYSLPEEYLMLPQYSDKYNKFIFSEVIMMPRKEWDRHSLSVIYKDLKYVCSNKIDWDSCNIKERIDEKLFARLKGDKSFNEEEDISMKIEADTLSYLRRIAYEVIEANLTFLKKYPPQKY